ncbi:MAG: YqaJ-like viral recombinase domain protein [Thermoleophilia bacterium]|nr:YqaJ-like viral recombinase domain protein [Thermoleophilia bacterium]
MNDTLTHTPTPGVSFANYDAWLEQRRHGITATEVSKLASGRGSDRRTIQIEKLTGEHKNLDGNRYIEHGRIREEHIARWIENNFDIAPSDVLYAGANPKHLATPDGVSHDFVHDRLTSEVKTSKHNLDPFDGRSQEKVVTPSSARTGYFWTTGYYDQIQWQMHVMGGTRVLFAWEQHDDAWPDPRPLHDEPRWVWIDRDEVRIEELVAIADDFLIEISTKRPSDIAPVGDIAAEQADLIHQLLKFRDDEAVAKKQKELIWAKLMPNTKAITPEDEGFIADYSAQNDEATVSLSTTVKDVDELDIDAMRARAPRLVSQYENLVARHTKRVTKTTRSFTVTAKKTNPKKEN